MPCKRLTAQLAVLDLDGCDLVLSVAPTAGVERPPYGRSGTGAIGFVSTDLDGDVARLRTRGVVVQEILAQPEGRIAVVADPDGQFVELIQ